MPDSVTIEPACAEDAIDFVALRGLTRENAISAEQLASIGITSDSWAERMTSGVLIGYTAQVDRHLVGYCFGDTRTGEVVVLALLPSAEGRGVGRTLLTRVVFALQNFGHHKVWLACSADRGVRSHGFYRHLGWRPTGASNNHGDEILELR